MPSPQVIDILLSDDKTQPDPFDQIKEPLCLPEQQIILEQVP